MVEPSTRNHSNTVKGRNVIGSEETTMNVRIYLEQGSIREKIADNTAHTMNGEDIESIVNTDPELEFGSIIA